MWASYAKAIFRIAASYEAIPTLREELIQDIALACWKNLEGCKTSHSEKAFVLRIAHNKAVDHVSREAKRPCTSVNIDASLVADMNIDKDIGY